MTVFTRRCRITNMPLFMDFHIIEDITVDEVKRAHIADLEVQDKYDVTYHQFWVNENAGTLFCLIEGPDKESCKNVHREAHGNIACQITEVEEGFFKSLMGESFTVDHGLVLGREGKIDDATRFILAVDIRGNTKARGIKDLNKLFLPDAPKKLIRRMIPIYHGRHIQGNDYVMAAFDDADNAISCAIEIQAELLKNIDLNRENGWNITFRIGISGGQPVTMGNDFFEKTILLAHRLCLISGENEMVVSSLVKKCCNIDKKIKPLKSIQLPEEEFLKTLVEITENKMSDSSFTVKRLCREIGISRPQLYRKIVSITGKSPNHFIRDIKMKRAMVLIKERNLNISEISLQVGYNNPSYFSRCFQNAYGIAPSRFLK